jgi:hypothetical protein
LLSVPDEELFVRPADGVASVTLDGEAVIYSEESAGVHLLDPIATVVWERLDATASLAEVIASLAEDFQADRDLIGEDVRSLVLSLSQQRLLAVVGEAQQ